MFLAIIFSLWIVFSNPLPFLAKLSHSNAIYRIFTVHWDIEAFHHIFHVIGLKIDKHGNYGNNISIHLVIKNLLNVSYMFSAGC